LYKLHGFKPLYNSLNNPATAARREDELCLTLVVAYCVAFISSRREQVSDATRQCKNGTLNLHQFSVRKKQIITTMYLGPFSEL
jgi:hypothetical protein